MMDAYMMAMIAEIKTMISCSLWKSENLKIQNISSVAEDE